jgi:hypothetical protein
MDAFRLSVNLVTGVAWPLVVLWIVLAFRSEIRTVLGARNTRLKAGPFELGIEQARVDVEAATAAADVTQSRTGPTLGFGEVPSEIADRADSDPTGTILRAYGLIEEALRAKLAGDGTSVANLTKLSGVQLAALAAAQGLISPQAVEAVRGVAVLRNLTAHGQRGEIGTEKALDYVSLIDATLFALRAGPGRPPANS